MTTDCTEDRFLAFYETALGPEAKFDPDQPRVPGGREGGGRWRRGAIGGLLGAIGDAGDVFSSVGPVSWKPVMTPSEAERWAADSAFKDRGQHITDAARAATIKDKGFKVGGVSGWGRLWGDGVYQSIGMDRMEAREFYSVKFDQPEVMMTMVNVKKPAHVNIGKTGGHGLSLIADDIGGLKMRQDFERRQRELGEGESQAFTAVLKEAGYDSIIVDDGNPSGLNTKVGGDQIVVFDPKQVVVLDLTAEREAMRRMKSAKHMGPGPHPSGSLQSVHSPIGSTARAAADLLMKANGQERTVTPLLLRLADDHDGRMEKLEFKLKTEESLRRKINLYTRKGIEPRVVTREVIGDALRYTMVADKSRLAPMARQVLGQLEGEGHKVDSIKNTFKPGETYVGINVKLRSPDGLKWELQFHTPQSVKVADRNHLIFEDARKADADPDNVARWNEEMRANSATLEWTPELEALTWPGGGA